MSSSAVNSDLILKDLEQIRSARPLIHCITNTVSIQLVANTLLALGASPIMAHSGKESEEVVRSAGALVLNTGTPDTDRARAMRRTARCARDAGIPVVLDPVGVGISRFRRELCAALLPFTTSGGIRANATEILALAAAVSGTGFGAGGTGPRPSGIDSTQAAGQAVPAAMTLLDRTGAVCITGERDEICTSESRVSLALGHPLMKKVTGMGCAHSAVLGAFLAVQRNLLQAAVGASVVMGVAGSEAGERAGGPGGFPAYFLDILSSLDRDTVQARLRTAQVRIGRDEKEAL